MGQMQEIIDRITEFVNESNYEQALYQAIDAIKLLSRGQEQVMQELDSHKQSRVHDSGIRIGRSH